MASEPILITVLYFAGAQSAVKRQSEQVSLPSAAQDPGFPLTKLAERLSELHPDTGLAAVLATSQWSINEEMVPVDDVGGTWLRGGETIAVIPPVSGG
ncbi:hypothetical protein BKA62DRAFT_687401 [Auriculariales sp. MPI-PUGE-AT-0066]|nr:hypothetical protein BKA62DRAFT_687401 [Auriculariales sp. MPI-PUGE-AT-0066]